MFFEGSEKKFEIITNEALGPLRKRKQGFWKDVVKASGANILSGISNNYCDAYLLSESSLFVWDDRILMLTCGRTCLLEAILIFIEEFGTKNIDCLVFQRKNEYRAKEQRTSFLEDVERLKQKVSGTTMRFGKIHSHHNFLFHLEHAYVPVNGDTTTEMLMYDMSNEASKFLTQSENTTEETREFLRLQNVLPGFIIDDYCFQPYGYSLNAVKDDKYYTIHITPQESCPYISFETNLKINNDNANILTHFVGILKPASFDIMGFNSSVACFDFGKNYSRLAFFKDMLRIGYLVEFGYYFKDNLEIEKPFIY